MYCEGAIYMLVDLLNENTVRAWIEPEDWKEAGRAVGKLLVDMGSIEDEYIEGMLESVEKFGPYIVIVPGVALFHSKSDENVHRLCLALATVKEGIPFGAGEKDPVRILFAFASPNKKAHLLMMRELMSILKSDEMMQQIIDAPTDDEILRVIKENFT